MKTKLMKKIAIWAGFGIIMLTVIGYFAIDYGVYYVLRMVSGSGSAPATSKISPADGQGPNNANLYGTIQQSNPNQSTNLNQTTNPKQSIQQNQLEAALTENQTTEAGQTQSNQTQSSQTPSNQTPSSQTQSNQTQSNQTPSSQTPTSQTEAGQTAEISAKDAVQASAYDGTVTPEKIENAQNQITLREKTKVTTTLLSSLGTKEITLFMSMYADGMSIEEKKKTKALILQKLSEEQYNELIAIAAKLGLSQGKSYADSLKEFENK